MVESGCDWSLRRGGINLPILCVLGSEDRRIPGDAYRDPKPTNAHRSGHQQFHLFRGHLCSGPRCVSSPSSPKKVHVGIALHRPALLHYCPAFHPLERRPPPHPLPIPKHDHLHSLRHLRQISRELLLVDVCRRCLRASIVNTLIYLDFRDRRVSSLLGYLYDLEGLYVG